MSGKDSNRFEPQARATRAEVAARRLMENVIVPVTAQGWENDSGQWLYYN